jgi:hypothetical protein
MLLLLIYYSLGVLYAITTRKKIFGSNDEKIIGFVLSELFLIAAWLPIFLTSIIAYLIGYIECIISYLRAKKLAREEQSKED